MPLHLKIFLGVVLVPASARCWSPVQRSPTGSVCLTMSSRDLNTESPCARLGCCCTTCIAVKKFCTLCKPCRDRHTFFKQENPLGWVGSEADLINARRLLNVTRTWFISCTPFSEAMEEKTRYKRWSVTKCELPILSQKDEFASIAATSQIRNLLNDSKTVAENLAIILLEDVLGRCEFSTELCLLNDVLKQLWPLHHVRFLQLPAKRNFCRLNVRERHRRIGQTGAESSLSYSSSPSEDRLI